MAVISCRKCGGKIKIRHVFRWLNTSGPPLACVACSRDIAGLGAWISAYAFSGVLFFTSVYYRGELGEALGLAVPGWVMVSILALLMPAYLFSIAFLLVLRRA